MYLAVPAIHRVKIKERDKKNEYLDLAKELEKKVWNMKVTGVPIATGALGTVTKGLAKGLEYLEIRGRGKRMLTAALLRSTRILRES